MNRKEATKFFNDWLWETHSGHTQMMAGNWYCKEDIISMLVDATKETEQENSEKVERPRDWPDPPPLCCCEKEDCKKE